MTALDLHSHLAALASERAAAALAGLTANATYTAHLDDEIAATRDAFVGAAVTEIASLRAQLSGPQVG